MKPRGRLTAAEARIAEIAELHETQHIRLQTLLENAPECPAQQPAVRREDLRTAWRMCWNHFNQAKEVVDDTLYMAEYYRSEDLGLLLQEIRVNIGHASVENLRRFALPAEDAHQEWVNLVEMSRSVSIERSGERFGGGTAGTIAMFGTAFMNALGDQMVRDNRRLATDVDGVRSRSNERRQTFYRALGDLGRAAATLE